MTQWTSDWSILSQGVGIITYDIIIVIIGMD